MSLRSNKELAYGAATVVAASYVLDSPRVRTYLAPLLAALPVTAAAALAELRRRDPARPSVLEDVTAALARSGWVGDAVGLVLIHALSRHVLLAMRTTLKERKTAATDFAFGLAQRLPAVRRRLEAEMDKFEEETRAELGKRDRAAAAAVRLPVRGVSTASILSGMTAAAATENVKWTDGKVSGAVYSGEPNHLHFLNQVQGAFSPPRVVLRSPDRPWRLLTPHPTHHTQPSTPWPTRCIRTCGRACPGTTARSRP